MKPFREQIKEMKLWMIPFAIGVCMLAFSVVFIVVLRAYLSFGKLPPISGRLIAAGIEITFASPIVGGGLMVLSGLGIGRRKRCSRCGKVLKIKDFEAMGDSFLCPYCLNDKFNIY